MAEYKFQETKKSLDVSSADGKESKTFFLDVGNYSTLKRWITDLEKIQEAAGKMETAGTNGGTLESLKTLLEETIPFILGDGSFEFVWKVSNENIYSCLNFIVYLTGFLEEQLREIKKGYAQ